MMKIKLFIFSTPFQSRVSKKSAKKRYNDLSSSLVSETEGENSTLTYTQLRTPERENIDYTGDLKRLLASSYVNDGHGLQYTQVSDIYF